MDMHRSQNPVRDQGRDLIGAATRVPCAGEFGQSGPAPKEQPPRKLSGNKDRMGTNALESSAPLIFSADCSPKE
jgi:hypothetical protein